MAKVEINREYCKGCYLCVGVCPKGSLTIDSSLNKKGVKPVVLKKGAVCIGCCLCATMCPDCCIEIIKE